MSTDFNPYAPPQAELDPGPLDGPGYCREGELLRMTLGVRLPERCIRCNESAAGSYLQRSFLRRPVWWRWVAWVSIGLLYVLNLSIFPWGPLAFSLGLICVLVADRFLRRTIVVEYGLCTHHRRLRLGVRGGFLATWLSLIGLVVASANGMRAVEHWWFWTLAAAMFVLAIAASMLYRFTLAQAVGEQIWLRGTGRTFLMSLPAPNE